MTKAPLPPLFIGTSGWSYRSWRGPFFPATLPAHRHLDYYAHFFRSTELNGVFYRTPTPKAVRAWAAQTPDEFVFAWKASKYITHWKRLKPDTRHSLALMESRLRLLKSKAGPVLFSFPRNSRRTRRDYRRFSNVSARSVPTCSNFVTRVGMHLTSSNSCVTTRARFAFRTMRMRPRHGKSPLRMSTFAGTDLSATIAVGMRLRRSPLGHGDCRVSATMDTASTSISTMTKRARPPSTRSVWHVSLACDQISRQDYTLIDNNKAGLIPGAYRHELSSLPYDGCGFPQRYSGSASGNQGRSR